MLSVQRMFIVTTKNERVTHVKKSSGLHCARLETRPEDGLLKRSVEPLWWLESLALHEGSLSLVGFSKGCVVLNQIVHEFHYAQALTSGHEHMTRVVHRVRELYWLDGGHSGGRGAWLTEPPLLHTLAGTGVKIYIHVSPYQVEDESRPWIGREEKIFTSLLKKLGAKVERYSHAAGGAPSLHTHFALLESFKRLQDSALDHRP